MARLLTSSHVKHAVLLTGTPLLSRPIEIFPQIDMLAPRLLGTYDTFGKRYCITPGQPPPPRPMSGSPRDYAIWKSMQYKGACNLTELSQVLAATVVLRRTKSQPEVAAQLPAKIRQRIHIGIPPAAASKLGRTFADLKALEGLMASAPPSAGREVEQLRRLKDRVMMEAGDGAGEGPGGEGGDLGDVGEGSTEEDPCLLSP